MTKYIQNTKNYFKLNSLSNKCGKQNMFMGRWITFWMILTSSEVKVGWMGSNYLSPTVRRGWRKYVKVFKWIKGMFRIVNFEKLDFKMDSLETQFSTAASCSIFDNLSWSLLPQLDG